MALPVREKIRHALRLDRAVRLVWQASCGWTLVNGLLVLIQGAFPLVPLYLIKKIIDAVAAALNGATPHNGFEPIAVYIFLAAAAAVFTALIGQAVRHTKETQAAIVTDYMYATLHAKSIAVDLSYYEDSRYFDTLHRAQQEGPYRPTRIVDGLLQFGQHTVSLLAMGGVLLLFHWGAALVLLLAVIPGLVVRLFYAGAQFRLHRRRTMRQREAGYLSFLLTGDAAAREIRLFRLGPHLIRRFNHIRRSLREERLAMSRKQAIAAALAEAAAAVPVFGAFAYIAWQAVNGAITLGDLVLYFQALQRALGGLKGMMGSLADLYEDNLFLANLYEFLDIETTVRKPSQPVELAAAGPVSLRMEALSFHYPGCRQNALDAVTMAVNPGEVVALVGANGCGKSTLVKLICRMYDPQTGRITMDGHDLRRLDPEAVRERISVVFQDFMRYQMTVRDNIRCGRMAAPRDDRAIAAAMHNAGGSQLIRRLPEGYDTLLGRLFEAGQELSVGSGRKSHWQGLSCGMPA
jgi:ATP-binding cassette subfamily B protein